MESVKASEPLSNFFSFSKSADIEFEDCLSEFNAKFELPFQMQQVIQVLVNKEAFPQKADIHFSSEKARKQEHNGKMYDSTDLYFKNNFEEQMLHELTISLNNVANVPKYLQVKMLNHYLVFDTTQ